MMIFVPIEDCSSERLANSKRQSKEIGGYPKDFD